MRWDIKNLSQFMDTRKASSPIWKAIYLTPEGDRTLWTATDSHNVAQFDTDRIKGLRTPMAVPDGPGLVKVLHENPDAELHHTNHLIVEWEKVTRVEATEEQKAEGWEAPPPLHERQSVSFETASTARDGVPKPWVWLDHHQSCPSRRLLRLGLDASQARIFGSLKDAKQLKKGGEGAGSETAVIQITSRVGAITFRLPNSTKGFRGAMTLNSLHTEAMQ